MAAGRALSGRAVRAIASSLHPRWAGCSSDATAAGGIACSSGSNAAVTARPCKQTRRGRNSQLATRSRHHSRTASTPRASAAARCATANDSSGQQSETRDPMAPITDVALAGRCWSTTDTNRVRRKTHSVRGVPGMAGSPLAAAPARRLEGGPCSAQRSRCVDVHPPLRGKLDGFGCALLGRAPDGPDLPRGVRRRVSSPPRHGRPLACVHPATCRPTSSRRLQALGTSRLRSVAEYGETVRLAGIAA